MINKPKLFHFLRFSIGLILLAIIVSQTELAELYRLFFSLQLHFILIGFLGLLLDRVLMSYRWLILLRQKGIEISLYSLTKIYFLSSFLGNILPSSIAPDIIRIYVASKHKANTHDVVSSVIVDRILGTISLALVASISFFAILSFRQTTIDLTILGVILLTLFGIIISIAVFDRMPLKTIQDWLGLSQENVLRRMMMKFYNSLQGYKGNKDQLARVFSISVLQQILYVMVVYMICLSANQDIAILYLLVFVPLISFLAMIPISLAGLGIQEGGFVYCFSQIGISTHEALTVALILRALMIIVSLPGGAIYAVEGFEIRRAITQSTTLSGLGSRIER